MMMMVIEEYLMHTPIILMHKGLYSFHDGSQIHGMHVRRTSAWMVIGMCVCVCVLVLFDCWNIDTKRKAFLFQSILLCFHISAAPILRTGGLLRLFGVVVVVVVCINVHRMCLIL